LLHKKFYFSDFFLKKPFRSVRQPPPAAHAPASALCGTDDYGFSALPSGFRASEGYFFAVGDNGFWWSATENEAGRAIQRPMRYNSNYVVVSVQDKDRGGTVRCAKD
jgi:uncharacterized protein (TIGR02145 family)